MSKLSDVTDSKVAELEQWLVDHPDADITAVREVRRRLAEAKTKSINKINNNDDNNRNN